MDAEKRIELATEIITNPLINRATLATMMFPENTTGAKQSLYNKLNNVRTARITEEDCDRVVRVFKKELIHKLNKLLDNG